VDVAAPAISAARDNFARSGVDPAAHEFVVGDAFEFLARASERFDVVVCDPPSFAPSEKVRPRALAAYRRLNAAAADAVRPGGLLVTASCSSHVSEVDFLEVLASVPRPLRIVEIRGAAGDHPVLPAFPEGRYLKLAIAAV
jgi:23S rRNA (cytosine1962-C5)-methyltransferase